MPKSVAGMAVGAILESPLPGQVKSMEQGDGVGKKISFSPGQGKAQE
jgi:hypothetical protein